MLVKSKYLFFAAAAILAAPSVARANLLAYDGFRPSFPVYANSGSGFAGPWIQGGFNVTASGYSPAESSLCYPRLTTSPGSISGFAFQELDGALRTLAFPLGADNTVAYISFLLQPRGTLNSGALNGYFGLTLNGSLGNDLFIGKPGAEAEQQYVLETRGGAGQVPSGVPTVSGRTVLLVLKAHFLPGNDMFTLYINPTSAHTEPVTGIVKADLDLGTVAKIGIYSTGEFGIDEIRIGTTYTDVLPTDETLPFVACLAGQ